jgi:hypothetical protein
MSTPSPTSKVSKADALARVQDLIAGTQKHLPNNSFILGNVTYTTAALLQVLQGLENALAAVNTAQASAKDALNTARGAETSSTPIVAAYVRFLRAAYNNATSTLADFGLQPPKARTPLTAEQKTAAVAKAKATRAARGTTSKKQKLAVSGNVTGVNITPITAPAAPQPSPAPTPTATPAVTPATSGK